MKKLCGKMLMIISFVLMHLVAHAEEVKFKKSDHCLAYRASKKMFFFISSDVIGKSCHVNSKLHWAKNREKVLFDIRVPVNTLNTGISLRDTNLFRMLRGDKYPDIRLITRLISVSELKTAFSKRELLLPGNLEVRGKSFPVSISLNIEKTAGKTIIKGKLSTYLSYLGIKMPIVGPWGFFEDPNDGLEIMIHLDLNRIDESLSLII